MNWELSIGTYPGIVLGVRTYLQEGSTDYVLYLPFVDLCLSILHDEDGTI